MKCQSARDCIVLLNYGELPDELAGVLEQHLTGCEDCREELEAFLYGGDGGFDVLELAAERFVATPELVALAFELVDLGDRGALKARRGLRGGRVHAGSLVARNRGGQGLGACVCLWIAADTPQAAPFFAVDNACHYKRTLIAS